MLLTILISLLPAISPTPVSKFARPLAEYVDGSTLVCIGTVEELVTVDCAEDVEARIDGAGPMRRLEYGRVRVERVLKGDPDVKQVFHETWTTWPCDTTRRTIGERSLFLLGPGMTERFKKEQQAVVAKALGTTVILRNMDSGFGILPIQVADGVEFVYCWDVPTYMALPGKDFGSRFSDVVPYIETLAKFAPEKLLVGAAQRSHVDEDPPGRRAHFDVRILLDGSRRTAVWSDGGEHVTVDRIDDPRWTSLRTELCDLVGDADRSLGDSKGSWVDRRLSIRFKEHRLDFTQAHEVRLMKLAQADIDVARRALRAWAIVRESMDCPTCVDDRENDTRVLKGLER